jgi:hypothetical protein
VSFGVPLSKSPVSPLRLKRRCLERGHSGVSSHFLQKHSQAIHRNNSSLFLFTFSFRPCLSDSHCRVPFAAVELSLWTFGFRHSSLHFPFPLSILTSTLYFSFPPSLFTSNFMYLYSQECEISELPSAAANWSHSRTSLSSRTNYSHDSQSISQASNINYSLAEGGLLSDDWCSCGHDDVAR